jgi:hypothetical protein
MTSKCRRMSLIVLTLSLTALARPARAEPLRYRDWTVGTSVLIAQSILHDTAKVYNLGEASGGTFQAAMLISEDPDVEDSGTKNAVLFECGMHAREWYAAETCYWLIDYLLQRGDQALVREMLSHVDVWVTPQSNPGGRQIDDLMFGDPTRFAYVCTRGSAARMGMPCSGNSDCGANGFCHTSGWRANADTTSCALGVDPARNFSSGWNDAAADCGDEDARRCGEGGADCAANPGICPSGVPCSRTAMKYRGDAPFSEPETLNLRRFIDNHMISMVAILHTNAQQISNRWYDEGHAASVFMTDRLVDQSAAGSAAFLSAYYLPATADPKLDLHRTLGRGHGQFSAWLTSPSDAVLPGGPAELDYGTERNISTFYFELPVDSDLYYDYPYQDHENDGSNSYHPSGQAMANLWNQAILDLLTNVITQARAPQCPTDANLLPVYSECENRDFGLVGAKIASETDQPGLLDYNIATREEVLPAGAHRIVFAVQNFSRADVVQVPTVTTATVIIERNGTEVVREMVPVTLDPGERATYHVDHTFTEGAAYTVEVSLDTDDFSDNNLKRFAFRVPRRLVRARRNTLGNARIRLTRQNNRLFYDGSFLLDSQIQPAAAGVEIVVRGQQPYVPGQSVKPTSVVYRLPKGAPWWNASNPKQGHWIYHDPKGIAGPVKLFKIMQRKDKGMGYAVHVSFDATGTGLDRFATARSYTAQIEVVADRLLLSSVSKGRITELPPREKEPGDEPEEEPGWPSPNVN